MEVANIKGESRQKGGKHAVKRLRERGMLPAVIYGHGEAPETVSVSRHDLDLAIDHHAMVIALEIDGKQSEYLIKEVQYDHLQKDPLHVDLMRVNRDEIVQVSIPLDFKGIPEVVVNHEGELVTVLTELEVECAMRSIPESVRVDIGHLALNDTVHIGDLNLPDGVKPVAEPDEPVVTVKPPRIEEEPEEETEAEEGAEPELIGREGAEEEGEGEGEGEKEEQ